MSRPSYGRWAGSLLMAGLIGCHREAATTVLPAGGKAPEAGANSFVGSKAGDERKVSGIRLCWCPAGQFLMGSPPSEPDRRPDEDQVEVTLTKGFWMAKYEVTQGTCMATPSSGAGTGITRNSPAASIRTCMRPGPSRA